MGMQRPLAHLKLTSLQVPENKCCNIYNKYFLLTIFAAFKPNIYVKLGMHVLVTYMSVNNAIETVTVKYVSLIIMNNYSELHHCCRHSRCLHHIWTFPGCTCRNCTGIQRRCNCGVLSGKGHQIVYMYPYLVLLILEFLPARLAKLSYGLDSNVTQLLANMLTKPSVFYYLSIVFCNLVSIKLLLL